MQPELAERLVSSLVDAGVDFVSYLPETRLSEIIPLLEQRPSVTLVRTPHEGTAVSIACGAALTGKRPAVYMESSGLYVSTFSLQTIAGRTRLPIVILATYIGSQQDKRNTYVYASSGPPLPGLLQTLQIPFQVLEDGSKLEDKVVDTVRTARVSKRPCALLFTGEFTI